MKPKGHLVYYEVQLFMVQRNLQLVHNRSNCGPTILSRGLRPIEPNLRWVCNNAIFSRSHPSFCQSSLKLKIFNSKLFIRWLSRIFLTMPLPWKWLKEWIFSHQWRKNYKSSVRNWPDTPRSLGFRSGPKVGPNIFFVQYETQTRFFVHFEKNLAI